MRIWPKAAILVVISLYFGLVHAEVLEGPNAGPGRGPAADRMAARLAAFYDQRLRFAALELDEAAGPAAVPLVLLEVLRHAHHADTSVQRRNQQLVAFAGRLVWDAGNLDPFTSDHIARTIARLLARYEHTSQTRATLIMILDRLNLWGGEHLPFLARRAGSLDDGEADEFGTRALLVVDQEDGASMAPMVAALRRQREPRRPAQWALLSRSGLIADTELALLIQLLAHEFARADGFVELVPELMPDEPLRAEIERVMQGLQDQDETTHSAFLMAQDQSEEAGDEDSPRVHRRVFFRRLIEGDLFGRVNEQDDDVPIAINQNGDIAPRARPAVRRDGNVLHAQFGTGKVVDCQTDLL